jgi:hypothetical protein
VSSRAVAGERLAFGRERIVMLSGRWDGSLLVRKEDGDVGEALVVLLLELHLLLLLLLLLAVEAVVAPLEDDEDRGGSVWT